MSATPLTDRESRVLRVDGEFIVNNTIPLLFETLFWGMYTVVFIFAMYSLWGKTVRNGAAASGSRARLCMLFTTIYMFLSSTTLVLLGVYRMMIQVKYIHLTRTLEGQSLGQKTAVALAAYYKANYAGNLLFALELLIGDAVVIWRTWALWQDRLWPLVFPVGIWVGSLGTYLTWVVVVPLNVTRSGSGGWNRDAFQGLAQHLKLSNFVLSIGANASATFLIAWKAWEYRKSIKQSFGVSGSRTKVQKVLTLFVESGFIYLVVWSVQTMSYNTPPTYGPTVVAAGVLGYSGNQIVGLYPTLIIVLVWWQQTVWDAPEVSIQAMTTMRYASRPVHPSDTIEVGMEASQSTAPDGDSATSFKEDREKEQRRLRLTDVAV